MSKGHKTFTLRGGCDHNDFPSREITLKDVRALGRSSWEKWGHMVPDWPIRDLIALAYAEGVWHGAMIFKRDMSGTTLGSASPAVASAASSRTIETETPSVRDLLEFL